MFAAAVAKKDSVEGQRGTANARRTDAKSIEATSLPLLQEAPFGWREGRHLKGVAQDSGGAGGADFKGECGPKRDRLHWDFGRMHLFAAGESPTRGVGQPPDSRLVLQTKLRMGAVDDPLELEAEAIADGVMRAPFRGLKAGDLTRARQNESVFAVRGGLSREQDGAAKGMREAPGIVHEVLRSPGQALDPGTRTFMEGRLGYDFAHVRVHTGERAAQSADAVQAKAYTVGSRIAFAENQYQPWTGEGRKLLAHELAHTVQQTASKPPASKDYERSSEAGAAVLRRAPAPPTPAPLHPSILEDLKGKMLELFDKVDLSTRTTLHEHKTISISAVEELDTPGVIRYVYTVNEDWTSKSLEKAADDLGLTRWSDRPEAVTPGKFDKPGHAERLTLQADHEQYAVRAMAVSRPVCDQCSVAIETSEHTGVVVIEVKIPPPPKSGRPARKRASRTKPSGTKGSTKAARGKGAPPASTKPGVHADGANKVEPHGKGTAADPTKDSVHKGTVDSGVKTDPAAHPGRAEPRITADAHPGTGTVEPRVSGGSLAGEGGAGASLGEAALDAAASFVVESILVAAAVEFLSLAFKWVTYEKTNGPSEEEVKLRKLFYDGVEPGVKKSLEIHAAEIKQMSESSPEFPVYANVTVDLHESWSTTGVAGNETDHEINSADFVNLAVSFKKISHEETRDEDHWNIPFSDTDDYIQTRRVTYPVKVDLGETPAQHRWRMFLHWAAEAVKRHLSVRTVAGAQHFGGDVSAADLREERRREKAHEASLLDQRERDERRLMVLAYIEYTSHHGPEELLVDAMTYLEELDKPARRSMLLTEKRQFPSLGDKSGPLGANVLIGK